jgi:hypothetical protein
VKQSPVCIAAQARAVRLGDTNRAFSGLSSARYDCQAAHNHLESGEDQEYPRCSACGECAAEMKLLKLMEMAGLPLPPGSE